MLTGLYPSEHGVHRNDASRYLEGVKSVPQWATELGRETFLVSGGIPVLRKVAINRGFDDFDDSIRTDGSFYRPADKVVKRFLDLLELRSVGGVPFFTLLQMADLSFFDIPSPKSKQLEGREGAYNGKLQEIDEAIGKLRGVFKKMRVWDQLTVIIVGLQGTVKTEHEGLSSGLSLYDEIIRIPLVIKPSRKARDLSPSWKVDTPVTLVDLGVSLYKLLGVTTHKQSAFPVIDILDALEGKPLFDDDRPLFAESDLPAWRGWGQKLVSMRIGEWVFWPGNEPKLFNTYTDRLQLHNLYAKDYSTQQRLQIIWNKYHDALKIKEIDGVPKLLPYSMGEKLRVARNIFSRTVTIDAKIRDLSELELRRADDWQVLQWQVSILVESRNWPLLNQLLRNKKSHTPKEKTELKNWLTLLDLHFLKSKGNRDTNDSDLNCLFLASSFKNLSLLEIEAYDNQKICRDKETQSWVHAFVGHKLKKKKETTIFFEIAKGITDKRLERINLAKNFWMAGAEWDFNPELPSGPSVFDMFLSLVGNQEFVEFTKRKQAL